MVTETGEKNQKKGDKKERKKGRKKERKAQILVVPPAQWLEKGLV